ncbi:YhfH-like protein [Bacillus oleivorans]|uniref:YhfH-like protein n=1 Tax=Bacillus oleivorans TaxID=1448271 RepID=A0A285CSE5_9BACI|nr:YhfH-like protein [Bacillus oleivorans]
MNPLFTEETTEKAELKYCTDCGSIIEDFQIPYLNQCEKCLRNIEHE